MNDKDRKELAKIARELTFGLWRIHKMIDDNYREISIVLKLDAGQPQFETEYCFPKA